VIGLSIVMGGHTKKIEEEEEIKKLLLNKRENNQNLHIDFKNHEKD